MRILKFAVMYYALIEPTGKMERKEKENKKLEKIPCLKCGGNISHWFDSRLECVKCGQQFRYHKIKKSKRRLSKKCVTCKNQFKNSHSSVLNCSKKCSIKYRKKWFKKYNKNHQSEIIKSRKKYERRNPNRVKYPLKTK